MVKETKTESPVLFMSEASFSYAGGHSGAGVEGISLSLGKGEVALLCGPSGCGKTTVTRLANGLAPHFYEGTETGTVRVCGLDVVHAELWETARFVGSVFQNPKTQFYNVDVRGEVAFGCENLGFEPADIERRVDASAKEFNLTPLIDESLFSLSGGQKQRVACASAAATSPALVVLDEPSSNLDFEAIAQLRMAISRWKATGTAVLVAEHRIHYLEGIADYVLYLDNGRLARRWTADEFARLDDAERIRLGLRARSADDAFRNSGCRSVPAMPYAQKAALGENVVRLENLTAHCRKNGVLEKTLEIASLELPVGSITALVGACGAGKSTFAEAVCGLNRCDGTVTLEGARLGKRARRRKCFMVMQDASTSSSRKAYLTRWCSAWRDPTGSNAGSTPCATSTSTCSPKITRCRFRAGSASASPSPKRLPPTGRSSSTTSRRAVSTSSTCDRSPKASAACVNEASRRSSSRTIRSSRYRAARTSP